MFGAIIGDIVGSRFEWNNYKSKDFELFTKQCMPTDDSIMTLAVAQAFLRAKADRSDLAEQAVVSMRELGAKYPNYGYGGRFAAWLQSDDPQPYGSWGNGSAMRVSPCAWAATSLEEAIRFSDAVTAVTHDHPEGMDGARAVTAAVWLARTGADKPTIREYIQRTYSLLRFTIDEIRPSYQFDVSCQGSVPQAIEAFLESDSFEDAIRTAVSIGGDSDTIAAITGSIAEAFYGVPAAIGARTLTYLDDTQRDILMQFSHSYGPKKTDKRLSANQNCLSRNAI